MASFWNPQHILLGVMLGLSGHMATGGMIRHDVDVERYRELGSKAEFRCVGRYSSTAESNDYASGVLISPQWLLTAAHFLGEQSVWKFGDETYTSKRVVKHPKLKPGSSENQWNGWDLALVELDRPVTKIAPATRYRAQAEVGSIITKIGYGYQGDGQNGMKSPPVQQRLGGQNVIEAAGGTFEDRTFGPDVLVFDFDSPTSAESNRFGSPEPLPLEIGGAKGDSGGGVFLRSAGEWQLVGIVSGGLNRQIRYGSIAALARISSANAWIDSVLQASSSK